MPRHRHGGKRTPNNPAPVSGPGALSRRTDGGPSTAPPMTDAGATHHGEGRDVEAIQQAGAGQPGAPQPGPQEASGQAPGAQVPGADPWGPTERPGESPTAGVNEPDPTPEDPDMWLREAYRMTGHPELRRLLERRDLA